jgi:hypothetical protein
MSSLSKPGTRAPRAPGGPAARRVWSSDDRARRGAACGASSRGRCWVTRRYDRTRRVPPPAACASPKNHRSFPRAFRSRFGVRAARRPTGAVRRLSSRACLSARGRALTGGRANPLDPRSPRGGPARLLRRTRADGAARPDRRVARPRKPGSRLVVLDACQAKHRVFRTS